MPAKPDIIRRIEQETGLKLKQDGIPGYRIENGRLDQILIMGELTRIPRSMIGLDCLLSLSNNKITEVPPNLGNNGGQNHIFLDNNLIESLPPECVNWDAIPEIRESGHVPGTFCVFLDGNPLKNPPPEIVAEGIEAIRSWFAGQGKPRPPSTLPSIETLAHPAEAGSASPQLRQTKIFLCYRREDTQGFAGRIYDNLASRYGQEHIFRDIDSTPAGIRYATWIDSRVRQCSVMIVLIGNTWLSAKDHAEQRRLDLPKDWVRREIEAALSSDIPIIPVRVQGAGMPSEEDLPSSIADLSEFQSAEVTDSRWAYDVELLIQAIDSLNAPES